MLNRQGGDAVFRKETFILRVTLVAEISREGLFLACLFQGLL